MTNTAIILKEDPPRRSIAETVLRFMVYLHGQPWGEILYTAHGYTGQLPIPCDRRLLIPGSPLSLIEQKVSLANKQWVHAQQAHAIDSAPINTPCRNMEIGSPQSTTYQYQLFAEL